MCGWLFFFIKIKRVNVEQTFAGLNDECNPKYVKVLFLLHFV